MQQIQKSLMILFGSQMRWRGQTTGWRLADRICSEGD
jgi:hypothetical protein